MNISHRSQGTQTQTTTNWQRKDHMDRLAERALVARTKRICLRCDKEFGSFSTENRICNTCYRMNSKKYDFGTVLY